MRAIRAARAVTCIALASALCVPAFAAQFDYYLKLPPIEGDSGKSQAQDDKHKNQIEILSYSWGATQTSSTHHGGGMGAGKVSMNDLSAAPEGATEGKVSKVEAISIKQTTHAEADGEAARANDRLRNAGPKDGWPSEQAGEAEITLKGDSADARKRPGKVKYGDITLKRGATAEGAAAGGVSVAAGDVDGDGRAETAKRKSGSLVYLNRTRQKELVIPASRGAGSLSLVVPAGMCRDGVHYPTAELGSPKGSHTLVGVVVTGCAAVASSDSRPMETMSLNYEEIK